MNLLLINIKATFNFTYHQHLLIKKNIKDKKNGENMEYSN